VTNLRYTLGPLDVLEITLYARPELGREVTISRKGTFRFPLIGQVRARGLTVSQLEKTLTLRLQDAQILEPHVVVTVKVYHNQHIFLLGQVHLPGVYALPDQVDLKDFIIQAQGLTAEADDYLIIIQGERQGGAGRAAFANHMREIPGTRVNLRKLMSGQVTLAVRLQSGDTIYVPKRLAGYAFSRFTCPDAGWHCPVPVALQVR
jgi:polysaccharide export outer membrane protein